MVTGGKSYYSGLCVFGAQNVKTIIVVRRLTMLKILCTTLPSTLCPQCTITFWLTSISDRVIQRFTPISDYSNRVIHCKLTALIECLNLLLEFLNFSIFYLIISFLLRYPKFYFQGW